MQMHWTGWLLVVASLAWNLLVTFLGPYLSSGIVVAVVGGWAPQIFVFPALWLAYGISTGAKRGLVAAGIVVISSTALWAAWRMRPEGKYMNFAEDVVFFVFLAAWMAAFVVGSTIHWFAHRFRATAKT